VALRQAISADYIPESVLVGNEVGQVRLMLVGLGLALLMIFRPQGILGDKREVAVSARR
jgi:ABC-type branched-subunit amino acid transport system permease subunit